MSEKKKPKTRARKVFGRVRVEIGDYVDGACRGTLWMTKNALHFRLLKRRRIYRIPLLKAVLAVMAGSKYE